MHDAVRTSGVETDGSRHVARHVADANRDEVGRLGAVVGTSNREALGACCNPDSSAALGVFYGLAPSVAAACMKSMTEWVQKDPIKCWLRGRATGDICSLALAGLRSNNEANGTLAASEPDVRIRGEERDPEVGYRVSSQMTCTLARSEAGCGCVYPM